MRYVFLRHSYRTWPGQQVLCFFISMSTMWHPVMSKKITHQRQVQPKSDAESGNWANLKTTLVRGESSNHCAVPARLKDGAPFCYWHTFCAWVISRRALNFSLPTFSKIQVDLYSYVTLQMVFFALTNNQLIRPVSRFWCSMRFLFAN